MVEFGIGFIGVVMAVWGATVSVHPPKERQFKIISLTAFVVGSVVLVVLLWIHTSDSAKEKRESAKAQQETQATLIQAQREFREFRDEVSNIQKAANAPNAQLETVLDGLNKTLGKQRSTPVYRTTDQAQNYPIATGTVTLKAAQPTTVLTTAVTATSKIQLGNFDDNVSGSLRVMNIVPGVSFNIVSSNGADSGKVFWIMYP